MKYLFSYTLLSIGLLACAQSKNVIKTAYGVYQVHLPGNIAVDKNGNEIASRDTINFIYIETANNEIKWDMAWKNGKNYSIISTLINSKLYDAGTKKLTGKNMLLKVSEDNKLWQLRLIPSDKNVEAPSNILPGEIIIRGSFNGKKIYQNINSLTELNSIPSV